MSVDLSSHKYLKIWQGPQHPGVTGNMAMELTLEGDIIVEAKTHVGYLHRGFEKLMERRRYIQCFPIVCRMCVIEPDFNEYNFATGTEELAGIEIPEMAVWLRMLTLEMSRLQSYLAWLGGAGATVGMGVVGQWTMYLRDLILDRFEELSGGRVYHMYIIPGGVRNLLPDGFEKRLLDNLDTIEETIGNVEKVLFNNAVYKARSVGTAVIKKEWIDEYGIVGPNARAAGVPLDVRKDTPYLAYDKLDFETIMATESDVYTRAVLRKNDLLLSVDLIRQILAKMPKGKKDFKAETPNVLHWKVPKGETYVKSEATRGEYGFYMVSDGTPYPRRVNLRGPSYTHAITLLEMMLKGQNVSDVAMIMNSVHSCPPEIER